MNRQSVRIFSRLLAITGIILPTQIEKNRSSQVIGLIRTCSSLLIMGSATASVILHTYQHRSNPSEFSLALPYIGTGFNVLITFLALINMRHELDHFLRRIDQNIFTYSQEDQILTDYPWLYRESNAKSVYCLIFLYEFMGIIPLVFPLIDHFFIKGTSQSSSFPLQMPWDHAKHFWITYTMHTIMTVGMCWIISIILLFILFGVIEFSRQNMRLCEALTSITQRSEKTITGKLVHNVGIPNVQHVRDHQNLFDNEFQIHLKECIRHHQNMIELFQVFKRWFSVFFLTQLVADSLTFAAVFYNLFRANTWVVYSGLIGSSYIFVSTLFASCFVGEMFSDMNERIVAVIFYEIRWYEQSLSNKKLLSIFHSQARRPMDLYAFSIFKASFFTFSSLIRTSYSYLNILKASFSSKN